MNWFVNGILFAMGVAAFVLLIKPAVLVLEVIADWIEGFWAEMVALVKTRNWSLIIFAFGSLLVLGAAMAFGCWAIFHVVVARLLAR